MAAGEQVLYLTDDDIVRLSARTLGWSVRYARKCLHHRLALQEVLERVEDCAEDGRASLPFRGAILARGIIETQPFIEGNRQIALIALLTFLELNGCFVTAGRDERLAWVTGSDELAVETLAERIMDGVASRWGWPERD